MNNNKENWKEREIGSLWRNDSKDGGYYTGYVKVDGKMQRLVIFPNSFKEEGSKEADLRIYISKEKQA